TGSGTLYAFSPAGEQLWKFKKSDAPLLAVSAVRQSGGSYRIFTGGICRKLYMLNPEGKLVDTLSTQKNHITQLQSGDIYNDGREYLAMINTKSSRSGPIEASVIDPTTLKYKWRQSKISSFKPGKAYRIFSLKLADLNNDKKKDLLFGCSWANNKGKLAALTHEGKMLPLESKEELPDTNYRMNLMHKVRLAGKEMLMGHYGDMLVVYNMKGQQVDIADSSIAFANSAYHKESQTLYLGSGVSGGDGVYAIQLKSRNWKREFEKLKPVGKLTQIRKNIKILSQQISRYKAPTYQPDTEKITLVNNQLGDLLRAKSKAFDSQIEFVQRNKILQSLEKGELWATKSDKRDNHNKTEAQVIQTAKRFEAQGIKLMLKGGHGYSLSMSPDSIKKVIEAMPNTLWGFDFSEYDKSGPLKQELIDNIFKSMTPYFKDHGIKMYIRNKHSFWQGEAYIPLWKPWLFNRAAPQVIIPALEETNCRAQDLSLSARVGLWQAGYFDQWSCRAVTDNATFARTWEWSSQQTVSHHLRHLMSTASMGADVFTIDIFQPNKLEITKQLLPFFEMLNKGIIHIPKRKDLLSVSTLCLGMKSPPSEEYLNASVSKNHMSNKPMAFSRGGEKWGAAMVPDYDFSSYAYNVHRRTLNFLPEMPYGLIPIVPSEMSLTGTRFNEMIQTDGVDFYDNNGKKHSADKYKDTVKMALEKGAAKMPVRIIGKTHSIAARLDDKHIRVTLIDPGYVSPADHDVEVILQNIRASKCIDILSGKELKISNNRIKLTVPMGVCRIVDITCGK
ncbi:MAG: hypothetical protein HQL32_17790, partial [Planctomycetes bacterium]|nr:hypothetical protein [Planctomycetota bacterium]